MSNITVHQNQFKKLFDRSFVIDDLTDGGEYANYEIAKKGAHGSLLSAFSKKHENLHLCDICIYTPNVPLADHIASIVMHIRAGEEESVLRIGNFFNITSLEPWMYKFEAPEHLNRVAARLNGQEIVTVRDIQPSFVTRLIADIKENNPPRLMKKRARLKNKARSIVKKEILGLIFKDNSPGLLYRHNNKPKTISLHIDRMEIA
jgi:hypothetical protein